MTRLSTAPERHGPGPAEPAPLPFGGEESAACGGGMLLKLRSTVLPGVLPLTTLPVRPGDNDSRRRRFSDVLKAPMQDGVIHPMLHARALACTSADLATRRQRQQTTTVLRCPQAARALAWHVGRLVNQATAAPPVSGGGAWVACHETRRFSDVLRLLEPWRPVADEPPPAWLACGPLSGKVGSTRPGVGRRTPGEPPARPAPLTATCPVSS